MNYNNLVGRFIHSGDVVDWEFLSNKGLAQPFFDFINTDTFSGPQWVNLFQINEPIFRELVREFFASFEFDATPCRDVATLSGLRNAEMVNATRLTHSFWPSIGDGMYNVGNTKAQSIRNPRIKLVNRCITMTITGRKETTNRVTEIDLFYLYCIFGEGVVCNIPYWLAKYLKSVRDKSVIFRGMKTSLVKMEVIMELYEGECCWPATRGVMDEGEGDDEEGDGKGGNKGVGGSTDIYHDMSQGDWQQDERAHWMYDHTVRQFQHMSTYDNLEPHLQIDPFPRLYLTRRSLEVLRKFHWMILGGRFNKLSHVSSPLLSKPGEY
ncbi:hypothetical protein Tco_1354865 [Tanacetum coccineum]